MLAAKFVFAQIVVPHPTEAKVGGGKKASAEPSTVRRSKKASGIFGDSLRIKWGDFGAWELYRLSGIL